MSDLDPATNQARHNREPSLGPRRDIEAHGKMKKNIRR